MSIAALASAPMAETRNASARLVRKPWSRGLRAGTARIKYAPNVRIVRLMCSGRLDPTFVLEAFDRGIDGVFVAGCHLGDCHYEKGNYKAMRRYELLKTMLPQFGIDPRRLMLEWVSAAEGDKFARKAAEFVVDVARLGPIGREWEVD